MHVVQAAGSLAVRANAETVTPAEATTSTSGPQQRPVSLVRSLQYSVAIVRPADHCMRQSLTDPCGLGSWFTCIAADAAPLPPCSISGGRLQQDVHRAEQFLWEHPPVDRRGHGSRGSCVAAVHGEEAIQPTGLLRAGRAAAALLPRSTWLVTTGTSVSSTTAEIRVPKHHDDVVGV